MGTFNSISFDRLAAFLQLVGIATASSEVKLNNGVLTLKLVKRVSNTNVTPLAIAQVALFA